MAKEQFVGYLNKLYQVTLPKEIRDKYGLEIGNLIFLNFEGIVKRQEEIIKPQDLIKKKVLDKKEENN